MKYILSFVVLFSLSVSSCKKEQNRELLNAYFKFKNDGADVKITDDIALNSNTFDCIIKGDSALYIDVEKGVEGAGFYIHVNPLKDSTYVLDSLNVGYYIAPGDRIRYKTNNFYKGVLTIKRGTFQAKDLLNTLQGTFSYVAEDTFAHITHNITEGSFLMERKDE